MIIFVQFPASEFDPVKTALEFSGIEGHGQQQQQQQVQRHQKPLDKPKKPPNRNVGVGGVTPGSRQPPRNKTGVPMSQEERLRYAEELSMSSVGSICTVCGKIFRNREALENHILTTKMPGHGLLQEQRVKSNYAYASMEVSARLAPSEFLQEGFPSVDFLLPPPTPEHQSMLDPETGLERLPPTRAPAVEQAEEERAIGSRREETTAASQVKEEPSGSVEEDDDEDDDIMVPPVSVSIKEELRGSNRSDEKETGLAPEEAEASVNKKKPFMCMDCFKGFKRQAKLIKHVQKHHAVSLKPTVKLDPSANASDIVELTEQSSKCETGRWPCTVRITDFVYAFLLSACLHLYNSWP